MIKKISYLAAIAAAAITLTGCSVIDDIQISAERNAGSEFCDLEVQQSSLQELEYIGSIGGPTGGYCLLDWKTDSEMWSSEVYQTAFDGLTAQGYNADDLFLQQRLALQVVVAMFDNPYLDSGSDGKTGVDFIQEMNYGIPFSDLFIKDVESGQHFLTNLPTLERVNGSRIGATQFSPVSMKISDRINEAGSEEKTNFQFTGYTEYNTNAESFAAFKAIAEEQGNKWPEFEDDTVVPVWLVAQVSFNEANEVAMVKAIHSVGDPQFYLDQMKEQNAEIAAE